MKSALMTLMAALLFSLGGCVVAERDTAYYHPLYRDRYYGYYAQPHIVPVPERREVIVEPDRRDHVYGRDY